MKAKKDYYQILGIQRNASSDEIRKAYLIYAAKFHPDKHQGDAFFEERFKESKEAYEILSDDERRISYDIKKFGSTKIVRRSKQDEAGISGRVERSSRGRKLQIDLSHIDIYLTVFYLINLVAWVLVKRENQQNSQAGLIWSIFFCGVSAMLMWLFVTGLVHLKSPQHNRRRGLLVVYLFLSLIAGSLPLFTDWLS